MCTHIIGEQYCRNRNGAAGIGGVVGADICGQTQAPCSMSYHGLLLCPKTKEFFGNFAGFWEVMKPQLTKIPGNSSQKIVFRTRAGQIRQAPRVAGNRSFVRLTLPWRAWVDELVAPTTGTFEPTICAPVGLLEYARPSTAPPGMRRIYSGPVVVATG